MEIGDHGPGIPPDVQAQMWEPFFTTKDSGSGIGLGLAIAKKLITANGGQISVDCREGIGSRFRFSVPCAKEIN